MNAPRLFLIGLVLAALPLTAWGQHGPPPPTALSALLFVRFSGPEGASVALYQGCPTCRNIAMPVTVGLRPGYVYRIQLTGLPQAPHLSLFPTLEVRGSLAISPGLDPAKYPVPIVFSKHDIERVLAGAFLTKVYYLERPDQAAPIATEVESPVETEVRPGRDPVAEARALGRPVLILRFGERGIDPEQLVAESVAGTMLFPGETALAPPGAPPPLAWVCWPYYDPLLGLAPLDECLHDGGDGGLPAGIGPDGKLHGLDPADTVAEYSDSKGKRHLAISNRVCLCSPRFAVLRVELAPVLQHTITPLAGTETIQAKALIQALLPPRQNIQIEETAVMKGREKPTQLETLQGPVEVEKFQGLVEAIARVRNVEVVGVCQSRPEAPDCPLCLCKWADRQTALVGEVVTFYLKYTNQGGQPMTGVVVSDSLTARLEYVEGSAQADRDTVFTTQPNEAGSRILRWEIAGSLPAGKTGLLRFQAKVR